MIRRPSNKSSKKNFEVVKCFTKRSEIEKLCPDNPTKKKHEQRLPISEYEHYGFHQIEMTIEQARDRAKQLVALERLQEEAESRTRATRRLQKESLIVSAFLPKHLVLEFNQKLRDDYLGDDDEFIRSKNMTRWRAAQLVIKELKIKPEDWVDNKRRFYKEFAKREFSLGYIQNILTVMNKWGYFYSRKTKAFFEPIPNPRGRERTHIDDSYYESGKKSHESLPLKIHHLKKLELNLKEEQFYWVVISFWFGLRPKEVDSLTPENLGKIWKVTQKNRVKILQIYQSKLTSLQREHRWKSIPCLFDEQIDLIKLIGKINLKRPLVKTIHRYTEEGINTYAGRKGFENLMHSKGIELQYISKWLGHTSVDRTYRNYRDKNRVDIPENFQAL